MRRRSALVAAAALLACARPLPPPGGEADETPPQVIATVPEPLSTVEPSDDPVVFTFDATLGERGVNDAIVLVSPRTGTARVERSGATLRVRLEGGWKPGLVYRVIVLPGLLDRFQNRRTEPAELVFSTGPEIPSAIIAGLVLDRITGNPMADVVVEGMPRGDSLTFLTVPDSSAFFALQYLPVGSYQVRAFTDRNRNRELDPGEASAISSLLPVNRANDTLTTVLQVVPFDTVPARLESAEAVDSLHIRITTDDYLEPAADISLVEATLLVLPDSTPVPGPLRVLSPMAWDSLRASRDTTAADSAAGAAPPRAPLAPRMGGRPVDPDADPAPYQTFYVAVPAPLQPGGRYLVRIQGLTNISGRSGGGGAEAFEVPDRPPPGADTTSAGRRRP